MTKGKNSEDNSKPSPSNQEFSDVVDEVGEVSFFDEDNITTPSPSNQRFSDVIYDVLETNSPEQKFSSVIDETRNTSAKSNSISESNFSVKNSVQEIYKTLKEKDRSDVAQVSAAIKPQPEKSNATTKFSASATIDREPQISEVSQERSRGKTNAKADTNYSLEASN